MSASPFSFPGQLEATQQAISFRLLLSLYAIIPVCLALQWADGWLWQGYLQKNLPSSPNHFFLFQILFGTPHILASAILLASNQEYLKHYQNRLLWMSLAIIVFFGLGSLVIPYKALYLIAASWTVYHVLKQQHGIARGVCRLPEQAFQVLMWLSISAGFAVYVGIFLKNSLDAQQTEWVGHAAGGLCAGLFCATVYYQRCCPTLFSKCFLWANSLLILSSFYLYAQQYYFLAILAPRLVHDITAYVFYVTHDFNKHRPQPQNAVYRWAKHCHMPIVIVLPLLSFGAAFFLQAYGDPLVTYLGMALFEVEIRKAITLGLIGYFALMHYYTESFTWKQGSPYRQFIQFTK